MLSIDELCIMMEWLEKKNRELLLEIELLTAWIEEHRQSRPSRIGTGLSLAEKSDEYRSWRIVSFRLHQRRSRLKTEQDKTRTHLHAVNRRIEGMGTDFPDFPDFSDISLETDLTSTDACA